MSEVKNTNSQIEGIKKIKRVIDINYAFQSENFISIIAPILIFFIITMFILYSFSLKKIDAVTANQINIMLFLLYGVYFIYYVFKFKQYYEREIKR